MARGSTGLVLLATVALLAGCGGGPDPATSAASPSDPLAVSPSDPSGPAASSGDPTASATHPVGRNPAMTDDEALTRISSPQTGEQWFARPRPIAAPAWASGDELIGTEWALWYELGTREGATIVGVAGNDEVYLVFERAADGSYRQLDYPSPRESAATAVNPPEEHGVPHDKDVYYDSFAIPRTFELPSGDPVRLWSVGYGIVLPSTYLDHATETITSAGYIGRFEILRYEAPSSFVWSEFYDVSAPDGLTLENWYYVLRTPWGAEMALGYEPFGHVADVEWDSVHPMPAPDPRYPETAYLTDLNDSGCGPWDHDHVSVVHGLDDAGWVAAGTNERGRAVYLPTVDNPLLQTMYRLYAEHGWSVTEGQPALILDDFIAARGLVGYQTPSSGSWVVFLNPGLSARAWC